MYRDIKKDMPIIEIGISSYIFMYSVYILEIQVSVVNNF